ncbi:MAG: sigma-E processing peptidase SpoIIGA [Clostridia bacterium]|nr:sigma-E processing peptidase SpoIIGA [Clostridia bacterium]
MTIYLDVILLENLCMNYIILFATGLIHRVKIKNWRILISSLIGAIYATLSFAPILEVYSNFVFKVLLSVVMIYIAFRPSNAKLLFKELIIFYLVSFAFGGCAFALLYFIKPEDILARNGVLTGTYPIKIALLGGIIGFVIVNIAFKVVKGKLSKKDMFCEVTIFIKENKKTIKAFIDTGNLLKDPISGMPVVVVEALELEEIIPKEIILHLNEILEGKDTDILMKLPIEYMSKFRIIPFSSLGKQNRNVIRFYIRQSEN